MQYDYHFSITKQDLQLGCHCIENILKRQAEIFAPVVLVASLCSPSQLPQGRQGLLGDA